MQFLHVPRWAGCSDRLRDDVKREYQAEGIVDQSQHAKPLIRFWCPLASRQRQVTSKALPLNRTVDRQPSKPEDRDLVAAKFWRK
jgi:hypothetical protein